MSEPANGFAVRVAQLERKVDRLEALEPSVVKQQVTDIKEDIAEIKEDVQFVRRILIGFLVTFAVLAVGTVVTVMQITQPP